MGSSNYQDRDPPTQYSNLYTYLEEPRFAAGQTPMGVGEGQEGSRLAREGCFQTAAEHNEAMHSQDPPD